MHSLTYQRLPNFPHGVIAIIKLYKYYLWKTAAFFGILLKVA
jgi:hypothetical protein